MTAVWAIVISMPAVWGMVLSMPAVWLSVPAVWAIVISMPAGWAVVLSIPADVAYAVPLIVLVSLVYSVTRHERWSFILAHAVRLVFLISAVMLTALGVLFVLSKLA